MPGDSSEILLYQTEDLETRIQVRLEDETVWLTQVQMAELFQSSRQNIGQHIKNVFQEGELTSDSTIKKFFTVAQEGDREVERLTDHYNLDVIISVGYRVKSIRGTQFRIWATKRLREYIVKGFALDDERLQAGATQPDYFDELLQRVRAIRASEANFYRKVRQIYALSVDYDPAAEITKIFFATVQNKFLFAITGKTAAEIISERADANKPNMGLTSFKGAKITKADMGIAKNYLSEQDLKSLNLLVDGYLSFAEFQAQQRRVLYMKDWVERLDGFLTLNDQNILQDAGRVSHDLAMELAEKQYDVYKAKQKAIADSKEIDELDRQIKQIENKTKKKPE